ncbi:MAG: tripartite tricarboxylate transporter permease, partial [Thermodesulfobacteriota bacterium]
QRLTFGILELSDGVGLIPAIMGLFGVAEVIANVEEEMKRDLVTAKVKNLLPSLQDWKDSFWPIIRGSFLGFFIGILPGPAPVISAFSSYAIEKKLSRYPEKFGTGVIEGVAGPESANNAATGGAFIPLFTLGIPVNSVIAILLGAFMIHGIQPGPMIITKHPELFWGTVMSMYLGNAMLLVLNLPLIGLWVQVLKVPYPILFPLILLFCLIGVFSLNYSQVEIALMIGFGVFGYLARKFQFEMAPLVLAIVIGPMMENNLRLALVISQGSPMIFITHPISAVFIFITLALLISPLVPWIGKRRQKLQEKVEGEEV